MPSDVDVQNLSPDHQLRGFSKSPFMRNLLLAAMLHIIVIGGTSVGLLTKEDEKKKDADKEPDPVAKSDDDATGAQSSADGKAPADATADAGAAAQSTDAAAKTEETEGGEEKREPSEYEKKHMMDKEAPPTSPDASDIDISLDEYGL